MFAYTISLIPMNKLTDDNREELFSISEELGEYNDELVETKKEYREWRKAQIEVSEKEAELFGWNQFEIAKGKQNRNLELDTRLAKLHTKINRLDDQMNRLILFKIPRLTFEELQDFYTEGIFPELN